MLPYYTKEVIPINRTIKRGELYYADLGQGVGSEQNGYRPVVIIQNDVGNKHSPTVIVAAVTSKNSAKSKLPTHYEIGHEAGLEAPSIILTEQLRTIDKHRLTTYIGTLTSSQIKGLNHPGHQHRPDRTETQPSDALPLCQVRRELLRGRELHSQEGQTQ